MVSVFKREFLGAFRKLHGYITVSVTALLSALVFWFYNLSYAYETTNAVFSAMTIVAALIIPVTAVNMFPNRKKADTDSVYDMMPLSGADVVFGKYFAALAVTLIPTLIMMLYPVIGNVFGSIDMLQSYSVAFGYVFFEAALLAVCMLVSMSSRSHLRAYIFSYVVVAAWFLAGMLKVFIPEAPVASLIAFLVVCAAVAPILWLLTKKTVFSVAVSAVAVAVTVVCYVILPLSFGGLFETFIEKLSLFRQFDIFVYGIFNIESILLSLLVTVVFLFLTFRRYERRTVCKKREGLRITGITSVMLSICIVAAALSVNFAAAAAPDTLMLLDVTSAHKQSVGVEAKKFLAKTDKDVTIYVLESTESVDFDMYLKRVSACSDRISIEYVYNSHTPEFYTDKGIDAAAVTPDSLVLQCGDRWEYLSYTDLFLYHVESESIGTMDMSASEYSYYYQMFSSSQDYIQYLYALLYETSLKFQGDKQICTYVEYVTADIIPQMYYMTGHGVKDITSSSTPYSVLGLKIADISGGAVPADAASLLINMPTEDITSAEKDALLTYLERGGQITLITDTAALDFPNLCAVLAAYGMSADKDHVSVKIELEDDSKESADENDDAQAKAESEGTSGTGETTEFSPVLDYDNDILYYLEGNKLSITVDKANAIKRDPTVQDKLVHYPLLLTPAEEGSTQAVIACAAETTDNGAHIAWFTAGESFNNTKNQGYAPVVYAMSWVTMEFTSQVGNMPTVDYQQPTTPIESGTTIFIVLLVVIPIAFVVFGVISYYRRRKTK